MDEFSNFLLELAQIPLLWLIFGLFLAGQIYLFVLRRFGRKLIRKLYPHTKRLLSVNYLEGASTDRIIVRYQVPSDDPEELQIVLRTTVSGNFHFIDRVLARKFGGSFLSAKDQAHEPVTSLFKLVAVYGEVQITDWNALFNILQELKTLGFHHIQVHRKKLIIGNAGVNREVLENHEKIIELQKSIARGVEIGRKLRQFLEYNVICVKRVAGAVTVVLMAFFVIGGLFGIWFAIDLYPLVDESQIFVPYLAATGVLSLLIFLVLSIQKKSFSIVLRLFIGFFLAACVALGGLGPAIYYNGQCNGTETFGVEGTVINLKKIDQTSIKFTGLLWLLGDKYGNRVKAQFGVHRVEVKLAAGKVYHFSIPEAWWLSLSPDDKVEISIGQGCLDWNWVVQFHSINIPVSGIDKLTGDSG